MIAREHRFRFGDPLPKYVFKNSLFLVRYQRSTSFHLGIVVSKRVSKKAVERNRIKRVISESVMAFQKQDSVSLNIVIYVRSEIGNMDNHEIQREILSVLSAITQ